MKRKILSVLLCTAMVASLAVGCGGKKEEAKMDNAGTEASTDKPAGDLKIEVVAKGFQHDFWKAVNKGAQQAAEENGAEMNFVGPKSESDVAEQVEQLKNAINKKPSAICLAALDPDSVVGELDTAVAQNIPVIGFDSGAGDHQAILANAATDNKAAGALAAEELYKLIKDKVTDPADTVRIGVVAQDATSGSINGRTHGFVDKMIELIGKDKVAVEGHEQYNVKTDGAKVVIEVGIPATVDDAQAVTVANTLLNKSDLVAIYGSNEFAAKNIITANESLQKLGADKVVGIGFDAGKVQLDAIKSGVFAGSITQNPVQIGYKAVSLAIAASKGEKVESVDTGSLWYTKDNMEDPEVAACLYE